MSEIRTFTFLILTAIAVTACGGGDDEVEATPDAGPSCDTAALLPQAWRPIGKVSTGAVTATRADGVTTAIVDATAGGFMSAADNPYTYVDLATGARVDVSDVDALADRRWTVAFKRSSIRVNGGDSGPGGVTVAKVEAATLAEVTAAPAASAFASDDWSSDACAYVGTQVQEPATQLSDWYVYDDAQHRITGARATVYVIKADAATYKLRVVSYYDEKKTSAVYTVEWATL